MDDEQPLKYSEMCKSAHQRIDEAYSARDRKFKENIKSLQSEYELTKIQVKAARVINSLEYEFLIFQSDTTRIIKQRLEKFVSTQMKFYHDAVALFEKNYDEVPKIVETIEREKLSEKLNIQSFEESTSPETSFNPLNSGLSCSSESAQMEEDSQQGLDYGETENDSDSCEITDDSDNCETEKHFEIIDLPITEENINSF